MKFEKFYLLVLCLVYKKDTVNSLDSTGEIVEGNQTFFINKQLVGKIYILFHDSNLIFFSINQSLIGKQQKKPVKEKKCN